MAIVRVYNKARDITYVYESESYWDKELKQPRSRRRLIGRVDPETGNVVPTGKRTKKACDPPVPSDTSYYKELYEKALSAIEQKDHQMRELRTQLTAAESANKSFCRAINRASEILAISVSGKERSNG